MRKEEISNSETPKFMRARALSTHLSIGLSSVWALVKNERIKSIKLSSRTTVFNVAEVEKALFGEVA